MSRCLLLPGSADMIAEIARMLLNSGRPLEESLVIFPGKRPGHFLRRELSRAKGSAYCPPIILSLDELARDLAWRSGFVAREIEDLEAAARLYHLCDRRLPGGKEMPLERFLPWGFKIFSDLEELKMELVPASKLCHYDAIAGQKLPSRLQNILGNLSQIYDRFYANLENEGLGTRALYYSRAAEAKEIHQIPVVVIAGIFGLTTAEEEIFRKYQALPQTVFVLKNGPGIESLIERLDLKPELIGWPDHSPELLYYPAQDGEGQAMALNWALEGEQKEGRAVVLPLAETLFPVVDHVLGRFGDDWNISLGYPLLRTPLFSLIESIGRMLERAEGQWLYAPDYLGVLLHPYIKNISLAAESKFTRIICHAVEERILEAQQRFVLPEEIESDKNIAESSLRMAASEGGLAAQEVTQTIKELHGLLIHEFSAVNDIGSFAAKISKLVAMVAERSQAQEHPYAAGFLECTAAEMEAVIRSSLAPMKLESLGAYFRFLEAALAQASVHYPGTPLRGLQVLGFLETRNLNFEEVFILDVNEGVLPPHRQAETLLPAALRSDLGLPDQESREALIKYHFHTLIAGAKRAHLFYRQGRGQERSRLVEELWWRDQRQSGSLEMPNIRPVHFAASFGHRDPRPQPKSPPMMDILESKTFSASALDTYLRCPLQFYYAEVLGLEAKEDLEADPDRSRIGNMVHEILKNFYLKRRHRTLEIGPEDHREMALLVDECFRQEFGQHCDGRLSLIQKQVLERMKCLLEWDGERKPVVRECEKGYEGYLNLPRGLKVAIWGWIDRIEECQGKINIIDYKTGSSARLPQKSFSPAERERWTKSLASVQLPLYHELYKQNYQHDGALDCGLMLVGKKTIEIEWLYHKREEGPEVWHKYFMEAIVRLLEEILDPNLPFSPTTEPSTVCPGCDFKVMCDRQWR